MNSCGINMISGSRYDTLLHRFEECPQRSFQYIFGGTFECHSSCHKESMSTVRELFEDQTRPPTLECRPPCNDTDHRILTSCSHRYIDGHEGMAGNSYELHCSLTQN